MTRPETNGHPMICLDRPVHAWYFFHRYDYKTKLELYFIYRLDVSGFLCKFTDL